MPVSTLHLCTLCVPGTFFLFTGICVLGALFTLVFVPETKNKSLEEVEELFMTPELRKQHERERMAAKNISIGDPTPVDTRF